MSAMSGEIDYGRAVLEQRGNLKADGFSPVLISASDGYQKEVLPIERDQHPFSAAALFYMELLKGCFNISSAGLNFIDDFSSRFFR